MVKKEETHVMIDIETLGTVPGSCILAIGGYNLNTKSTFYVEIDLASCFAARLSVDAGTIEWWMKQKPEAQQVFHGKNKHQLSDALDMLRAWLPDPSDLIVWGNCATFDMVLIESALRAVKKAPLWKYTSVRSYRTLKAMYPGLKAPKAVIAHNAKDDSVAQGIHLSMILNHIYGKKVFN